MSHPAASEPAHPLTARQLAAGLAPEAATAGALPEPPTGTPSGTSYAPLAPQSYILPPASVPAPASVSALSSSSLSLSSLPRQPAAGPGPHTARCAKSCRSHAGRALLSSSIQPNKQPVTTAMFQDSQPSKPHQKSRWHEGSVAATNTYCAARCMGMKGPRHIAGHRRLQQRPSVRAAQPSACPARLRRRAMETRGTPPPAPRPGVGPSQVPHCCGIGSHCTREETCTALRGWLTYAPHSRWAWPAGSRWA